MIRLAELLPLDLESAEALAPRPFKVRTMGADLLLGQFSFVTREEALSFIEVYLSGVDKIHLGAGAQWECSWHDKPREKVHA